MNEDRYAGKKATIELQEKIGKLMALRDMHPDQVDEYYIKHVQPTIDQALLAYDFKFFERLAKFVAKKHQERLRGQIKEILKKQQDEYNQI